MAANVPSALLGVSLRFFLRGRPVVSGEVAADHIYGFRGLNSEVNHAYAYRVHTVEVMGGPESDDTEIASSAISYGYNAIGGSGCYGLHHSGEDVAKIRLVVDIEQGYAQLDWNGTTQATSGATTRAIKTADLTIASGDKGDLVKYQVKIKAQSNQTCKLYRLAIHELVLVAGDLP
jgi:hypothetical protein